MTREIRLSGKAAHFLQLLQDFGHLDDTTGTRAIMALAEDPTVARDGRAGLLDVRRAAAQVLFLRDAESEPDAVLAADWPVLFS